MEVRVSTEMLENINHSSKVSNVVVYDKHGRARPLQKNKWISSRLHGITPIFSVVSAMKMETSGSSEALVNIYRVHGVTSQNIAIFTLTAVRASNLTFSMGSTIHGTAQTHTVYSWTDKIWLGVFPYHNIPQQISADGAAAVNTLSLIGMLTIFLQICAGAKQVRSTHGTQGSQNFSDNATVIQ